MDVIIATERRRESFRSVFDLWARYRVSLSIDFYLKEAFIYLFFEVSTGDQVPALGGRLTTSLKYGGEFCSLRCGVCIMGSWWYYRKNNGILYLIKGSRRVYVCIQGILS